jgi:hypothetical protein
LNGLGGSELRFRLRELTFRLIEGCLKWPGVNFEE